MKIANSDFSPVKRSRFGDRGGERYMGVGDHEDEFEYVDQPELERPDFKIDI